MGKSMPKAKAHTIPPINREPVSPINTFAGCQFQIKKPMHAAALASPKAERPVIERIPAHKAKDRNAKKETVVFRPSIPSVKFTALTIPTMTTAAKG